MVIDFRFSVVRQKTGSGQVGIGPVHFQFVFPFQILPCGVQGIVAIGKQANKFIVAVTGVKSNTDWFNNAYESKGQGSGIIIANSGQELLILTERKVIAGASSVYVTFVNDTSVEASIKKYDGNTGITVLSVPVDEIDNDTMNLISVAGLGNSLAITQGTLALAVGSPLGTNYSILTGNITSSAYSISTIDANYDIFTTDIVGSKNGSGALINLNGEVIGLVTQGYSSEGDQNTLTAISISELKPVIEMLSNNKDIPYIGLEITTVTNTIAKENDIPKGVYIKEVKMDSPAMAAGLQSGDVITEIDAHVFKLLDIDYVHLPKISQSFKDSLPESTLLYNFTDQFIVGSGYTDASIAPAPKPYGTAKTNNVA